MNQMKIAQQLELQREQPSPRKVQRPDATLPKARGSPTWLTTSKISPRSEGVG